MVAYIKINRTDLAEMTLKQMKATDEDNCLTTLSACWLKVRLFSLIVLVVEIRDCYESGGIGVTTKPNGTEAWWLHDKNLQPISAKPNA